MSQPISGDQWVTVTGVGTTVTSARPTNLHRVILPGTYVGSVEWYDSATAAGTAATNLIYSVGLPTTSGVRSIDIHARTRYGLVHVATGTPTLTYTWGD